MSKNLLTLAIARKTLTDVKDQSIFCITDIARAKKMSMINQLAYCKKSDIKRVLLRIITQYNDGEILQLSPLHVELLIDWMVSEYNPETGIGGVLGYTYEDIHLVFRMGMRGTFGKPSGHKYVMSEISGSKGWFEQYHDIRNYELGKFYHSKNIDKMENIKLEIDESKVIPCPEKYKSDNKKIGSIPKSSKRVFNSIMDYCEFKKIDKIEFMQPHESEWKKHFKKLNDGVMTYQEFEFLQTSILLKKINFDYEYKKNK